MTGEREGLSEQAGQGWEENGPGVESSELEAAEHAAIGPTAPTAGEVVEPEAVELEPVELATGEPSEPHTMEAQTIEPQAIEPAPVEADEAQPGTIETAEHEPAPEMAETAEMAEMAEMPGPMDRVGSAESIDSSWPAEEESAAIDSLPRPTGPAVAPAPPSPTTAGALIAARLAAAGVRLVFTVPGESFLGILEALTEHGIRVVGTRHESGAAFMAEAVGQLTGRPAVCLATRAVGAANLAIGLHTARADSSPLIAIVGQVERRFQGREAFQEADLVGSLGRLCKWAGEAATPEAVPGLLATAIDAATSGRPGPVLLSVPEDVLDLPVEAAAGAARPARPRGPEPDLDDVGRVLHLLADARRPVILAGAGVLRGRCSDALVRFAELIEIPVVATWRRPDVFPNDHRLYVGMTGYAAAPTVLPRLSEADAMLVLGSRLNEVASFEYRVPGEGTRWAHVDLEPRTTRGDLRAPDVGITADAAAFLRIAARRLTAAVVDAATWDERRAKNAADRAAYESAAVVDAETWDGPGVHPGRVIATLERVLPPEAMLATDAGNFSGWAARGYRFRRPGTFLGPTSGAMGYGLPAAIAAALARPGRAVVALAGDGGFAMTMSELETAVRERARVISLVFDNRRYGTIWLHQQHRERGHGVGTELGPIDFAAAADAFGARGYRVDSDDEFEPALRSALAGDRPAVLHLQLDPRWRSVDERP